MQVGAVIAAVHSIVLGVLPAAELNGSRQMFQSADDTIMITRPGTSTLSRLRRCLNTVAAHDTVCFAKPHRAWAARL